MVASALALARISICSSVLHQDAKQGNFTAYSGKYELIETDSNDTTVPAALANSGAGAGGSSASSSGPPAKVLPCTLDSATKALVELVFK